jgi:autoinducer 2-degrading protein
MGPAMTGSSDAVVLIAELTSTVVGTTAVARLLADYRDRVRQEPGNVAFTPGADRDDPTSFWVYEEYADAAAFQAHLESAHNEEFNRAVGPHLHGGTSRLRMLTPLPREDADG